MDVSRVLVENSIGLAGVVDVANFEIHTYLVLEILNLVSQKSTR